MTPFVLWSLVPVVRCGLWYPWSHGDGTLGPEVLDALGPMGAMETPTPSWTVGNSPQHYRGEYSTAGCIYRGKYLPLQTGLGAPPSLPPAPSLKAETNAVDSTEL